MTKRGMSLERALGFACDSECQGRCPECPQEVIEAEINRLLAEVKRLQEMCDGWQPIEAAPKGGMAIDIWARHGHRYAGVEWNDLREQWRLPDGGYIHPADVTHWMPLPDPPSAPQRP